jgi:hypothetical protein
LARVSKFKLCLSELGDGLLKFEGHQSITAAQRAEADRPPSLLEDVDLDLDQLNSATRAGVARRQITSAAGRPDKSIRAIEQLPSPLAQRVLGWAVATERFRPRQRGWIRRCHFQQPNGVEDAFRLLDAAVSGFTLTAAEDQIFTALTRAGRGTGRATGKSEAATITHAKPNTYNFLNNSAVMMIMAQGLEDLLNGKSSHEEAAKEEVPTIRYFCPRCSLDHYGNASKGQEWKLCPFLRDHGWLREARETEAKVYVTEYDTRHHIQPVYSYRGDIYIPLRALREALPALPIPPSQNLRLLEGQEKQTSSRPAEIPTDRRHVMEENRRYGAGHLRRQNDSSEDW